MNKKLLGLFFIVTLAVIFFLTYPEKEEANLPPPIFVEVAKEKTSTPHKKMLDLANGRPTIKKESLKIDNKDNPCRDLMSELSENTFDEIKEVPDRLISLQGTGTCPDELKNIVDGTFLKGATEKCLKDENALMSKKCNMFLAMLRAWAISSNISGNDLAALDDTTLLNMFIWNFANNPKWAKDKIDRGIEIIDEILARNPHLYSAHKAKLTHLFIKEANYKAKIDDEIENTMETLDSLGSDEQVGEFSIFRELNKDEINYEKATIAIDKFIEKHPTSARGMYYLAALKWRENRNLDEVKSLLIKAQRINPKDRFVNNTINSLKVPGAKKPSFYFSMHFNFENL